ncbi:cupin domain-containing protein [Kordiimonas sp. A6E486]|nr:cupin domain-containing protein [Kordiimonas marina]MCJ9428900.1 cupin domain-containing protein [Kordiimonas marina]
MDFAGVKPEREESLPADDKLISGQPVQLTENVYEDKKGSFFTGFWSSAPGKWRVNYAGEEEFCHLLEGLVELADDEGNVSRFKAGDRFVISEGFSGTWETIEPSKKLYVISVVGA